MTESNNKGNNQALELMTQRNNFYTDKVKLLLSVVVLAMRCLVSISLIFWIKSNPPKPKFILAQPDGKFIKQPLSRSVMSDSALLTWANRAAVTAFTLNSVNYETELAKMSGLFTQQAGRNLKALISSNNEALTAKKLVSTAVATGAPVMSIRDH